MYEVIRPEEPERQMLPGLTSSTHAMIDGGVGKDVSYLSVSFLLDPQVDTPEVGDEIVAFGNPEHQVLSGHVSIEGE